MWSRKMNQFAIPRARSILRSRARDARLPSGGGLAETKAALPVMWKIQ
jgi:hypothetical protein